MTRVKIRGTTNDQAGAENDELRATAQVEKHSKYMDIQLLVGLFFFTSLYPSAFFLKFSTSHRPFACNIHFSIPMSFMVICFHILSFLFLHCDP